MREKWSKRLAMVCFFLSGFILFPVCSRSAQKTGKVSPRKKWRPQTGNSRKVVRTLSPGSFSYLWALILALFLQIGSEATKNGVSLQRPPNDVVTTSKRPCNGLEATSKRRRSDLETTSARALIKLHLLEESFYFLEWNWGWPRRRVARKNRSL